MKNVAEPIRVRKLARVAYNPAGRASLWGYSVPVAYKAVDTAQCWIHRQYLNPQLERLHHPPVTGCDCGFYAMANVDDVPERAQHQNWLLDVELYGRVKRHARGWRAEKQRVLAAVAPDRCVYCAGPCAALRLYGSSGLVYPVCGLSPTTVHGLDEQWGMSVSLDVLRAQLAPVEITERTKWTSTDSSTSSGK